MCRTTRVSALRQRCSDSMKGISPRGSVRSNSMARSSIWEEGSRRWRIAPPAGFSRRARSTCYLPRDPSHGLSTTTAIAISPAPAHQTGDGRSRFINRIFSIAVLRTLRGWGRRSAGIIGRLKLPSRTFSFGLNQTTRLRTIERYGTANARQNGPRIQPRSLS